MRPYISVDIETAGLHESSTILEISFVLDSSPEIPKEELEHVTFSPKFDYINYADPAALVINADLIKELSNKELKPIEFWMNSVVNLFNKASELAIKWDNEVGRKASDRIQLAGKNVSTFDLPRLKREYPLIAQLFSRKIQHRCIDVGSMYASKFGYTPSLLEIMQLIGSKNTKVRHRAYDDALAVIEAIRNHKNY